MPKETFSLSSSPYISLARPRPSWRTSTYIGIWLLWGDWLLCCALPGFTRLCNGKKESALIASQGKRAAVLNGGLNCAAHGKISAGFREQKWRSWAILCGRFLLGSAYPFMSAPVSDIQFLCCCISLRWKDLYNSERQSLHLTKLVPVAFIIHVSHFKSPVFPSPQSDDPLKSFCQSLCLLSCLFPTCLQSH